MDKNSIKFKLEELGLDESLNDKDFRYKYDLKPNILKGRIFFLFSITILFLLWSTKG